MSCPFAHMAHATARDGPPSCDGDVRAWPAWVTCACLAPLADATRDAAEDGFAGRRASVRHRACAPQRMPYGNGGIGVA